MTPEKIEQLRIIWKNNSLNTRDDYRALRRNKPELELPNDTVLGKDFGSFAEFKKAMINGKIQIEEKKNLSSFRDLASKIVSEIVEKTKESSKTQTPIITAEQKSEETLEEKLTRIFKENKIEKRDQYRKFVKNNPTLDLPSCHKISKLFGSFSKLKEIIYTDESVSIDIPKQIEEDKPKEVQQTPEKIIPENNDTVQIVTDAILFEKTEVNEEEPDETIKIEIQEELSKEEVEKSKEKTEEINNAIDIQDNKEAKEELEEYKGIKKLLIETFKENKIETRNQYRQFSKDHPELILPSRGQIEKLFGSFTELKDIIYGENPEDYGFKEDEIIKWKQEIKKMRLEIFGTTREPYSWDPQSRVGRFSSHLWH